VCVCVCVGRDNTTLSQLQRLVEICGMQHAPQIRKNKCLQCKRKAVRESGADCGVGREGKGVIDKAATAATY